MKKLLLDHTYRLAKKGGLLLGIDLPYFVKNGFWMTLRQIVDVAVGMLFLATFARLSTKESLGYYQFVISVFSIVSIISIPGINTALLRAVSRGYDGEYPSSVKESFKWSIAGVPIILFLGFYYFVFSDRTLGIILMTSSIIFPLFYAPNTWSAFLQGKTKYKEFTIFGSVQSAVNTFVTVAVIYFGRNLESN